MGNLGSGLEGIMGLGGKTNSVLLFQCASSSSTTYCSLVDKGVKYGHPWLVQFEKETVPKTGTEISSS